MKKIILLPIIVVLIFLGKKGFAKLVKLRNSKRLKIGIDGFNLPKLNLTSLFTSIPVNINLSLNNFSNSTFNIEQIGVDVFSPSGKLIAEQSNPLREAKQLLPNQNNILPLAFLISSQNFKDLIRETGGVANAGANFLTSGNYGVPIHLKGFVVAEGITIDINEKITV